MTYIIYEQEICDISFDVPIELLQEYFHCTVRIYQYMYQLLSTHGVGDSEVKWRRYLLVELRTCGIYECYQFYDHV